MAIIISASSLENQDVNNAIDMAKSLEPVYGRFSKYLIAIGLFAAGISSAITAPLAAAYAAQGCFAWDESKNTWQFRSVWACIILIGIGFSVLSYKPVEIIQFAQITNALLLPIIIGVLWWIVNQKSIMGSFKNTLLQNILSIIIFIASLFISLKGMNNVFNFI